TSDELVTGDVALQEPQLVQKTIVEEETNVVHDYEIRLKFDEDGDEEYFVPSTIVANAGDEIHLTFLLQEPIYITLEEFDIGEHVDHNTISFVADTPGDYDLFCQDCVGNVQIRVVIN
ncbi:hypothetical protein GOV10_06860, partial [Candidatus Woesearchaeota archaeon]|nr:hypothetical protein [Candidatus Woesearchaeota archaeon]